MRRLRPTPRRVAVLLAATVGIGAGVAYAASLTVGSWHLWAGSQTLTKGTCTLTGTTQTSDTYVTQATPNGTNGSSTTMLVRSNSGGVDWSFVSFDLSSCSLPTTGGADTATLTLFITTAPASNRTLSLAPVLTSWSPTTLSWNGAQSLSYGSTTTTITTGTSSNVSKSATVTVDVDALIKNPSASFGWRINDTTGSGNATTTFAASQNGTASRRPQLVINYEK
ncbi:MAG TPA: DNRLRE domain-containing protein [Gaiellaceae bacterium]|nr:DNRLRE domain-containing protein [Gaiellaceae bacterium]